ncbi:GSCOCG00010103001-RA-CDS [Cotesia congregata]|nr:GSCOCG00010103001-RA-CDS [Cotesia congregata]
MSDLSMTMSLAPKIPRGRGPVDGRAFFERLWRGNFFLDRQKAFKRTRKRKLQTANGKKRIQQQLQAKQQHCCCCQRIQFHLLAGRRNSMRSVVR